MRKYKLIAVIIAGLILNLGNAAACLYLVWTIIFSQPTFKVLCVGSDASAKNAICLFAFGQFAYGIVAVGQVAVGVFTLSQVGIGLLFGVGQMMAGIGFSVGQVASGCKCFGMLALGWYKAKIGFGFYETVKRMMKENVA